MDDTPFKSIAPLSDQTDQETSSRKLLIGHLSENRPSDMPKWCPWATSMLGYNEDEDYTYLVQIRCKRWGCRVCGERKAKSLSMRVAEAKPNRFMTLTVNPNVEYSPRDAFETNARKIPRLLKKLRQQFGPIEYFRVLEVTKKGWPHWHFLLRSGFIKQRTLSDVWCSLTGAKIVDIRAVQKSFAAYKYCVKYLAKQTYVPWTNRRTSWSKNFFPPPEPYESVRLKFHKKEHYEKPPHYMLTWLAGRMPIEVVSSDCIRLPKGDYIQ